MHLIGHRKSGAEKLLEQGQLVLEDFAQKTAQRAAPHVEAAKNKLVTDVLPAAQEAAATARSRAEEHLPHRKKKETHKVRNSAILLGLAGLGAAAWHKVAGNGHTPTSYAGPSSDSGGADPAEALSDADVRPHAATTPDFPREREYIDEIPLDEREP